MSLNYPNFIWSRSDANTADARRAIEFSRERRAALISAAVTGQLVPPETIRAPCETEE